jgi:CheY-like chemotaxis protein
MTDDNDRYSIGAESLNGITVLVVDDERVIRHLLRRTLHREGFRVVTASDGLEGLERIRGTKIDIVITDIMMPNMDGTELLVEIKSNFPSIPVILITGFAGQFTGKQALEAGAEDFIVKPFKNHDIRYALQRTIVRLQKM